MTTASAPGAQGWLTVVEIARHTKRSPSTITRAIQAGRVRAVQVRHETGSPSLVDPDGRCR